MIAPAASRGGWLALLPACIFLAILPVTHTVALRLICLSAAAIVAFIAWRREVPPAVPCRTPLLVWAGLALASLTWTVDFEYSIGEVQNEVGYALAAFLIFYTLTRSERELQLFLRVLAGSTLALSVFAIVNSVLHRDWSTAGAFGVGDRNTYSTFIVLATPALLLALLERRLAVAPRWLLGLTLVLAFVSGALTLNRTMWPAIGVGAAVYLALRARTRVAAASSRLKTAMIVLFVVGLATVQFLALNKYRHGLAELLSASQVHALAGNPRFDIWKYALERAQDRPSHGYGFGRGILRRDFRKKFANDLEWHAHNVFLNTAIALGIPGVLVLAWLYAALGGALWRIKRDDKCLVPALRACGLALLAAMVVRSLADDVIVRDNALLFWSLLGMSLGLGRRLAVGADARQPSA